MPGAELRRQRAAYRRGLLRASAIAAMIMVVVTSLALAAITQSRRADQQRRVAEAQRLEARRNLYAAQIKLAQQAWNDGQVRRALDLLNAQRPVHLLRGYPGQPDLRGWEWRYLWRVCQGDQQFTLAGHAGRVLAVAFSPDGRTIASGGEGGTVRLWDIVSRSEVARLTGHRGPVTAVSFSPDGKLLATGSMEGTARLWNAAGRRQTASLHWQGGFDIGHGNKGVTFSPDGKTLATAHQGGIVALWNVATKQEMAILKGHSGRVQAAAFSPNGSLLASGSQDATVKLWRAASFAETDAPSGRP